MLSEGELVGEQTAIEGDLKPELLSGKPNCRVYTDWDKFADDINPSDLYGFLRRHHEHVFKDQGTMEEYLRKVFADGGTVVVDRETKTKRMVGFIDGRPQESAYGKMLIVSEGTNERKSFQSMATLLENLIKNHIDCVAVLFSLPLKSEADKRRAKIYQRVGFQPDERFVTVQSHGHTSLSVDNPERVCYSMATNELMKKIKIFTERR